MSKYEQGSQAQGINGGKARVRNADTPVSAPHKKTARRLAACQAGFDKYVNSNASARAGMTRPGSQRKHREVGR